VLKLLTNAHIFAPEDLGLQHVLVGGGRILGISDDKAMLAVAGKRVSALGYPLFR